MKNIILTLTEPSSALRPDDRRNARLLAGLLLMLAVFGLISGMVQLLVVPEFGPTFVVILTAVGVLILAYFGSRTRHYRLAALLASLIPIAAGVAVGIRFPDDPAWFAFASFSVVMAMIFLGLRLTALVAAICVGAVASVVLFAPVHYAHGVPVVMYNVILAALILLASHHWTALAKIRQQELRARDQTQRSILDTTFSGIAVHRAGIVSQANKAFVEAFGLQEPKTQGIAIADLVDPGDTANVERLIQEGNGEIQEIRNRSGSTHLEFLSTRRIGAGGPTEVAAVRDITERKELEANLIQAQRLETLGKLTSGVAHDFNNLLTVILGSAEILNAELKASQRPTLNNLVLAAGQAAELTSRLLTFSRNQFHEPKVLDLRKLCDDSRPLIEQLAGERVELSFDFAPNLGCVRAVPDQLVQVLTNLVVNARDAMPEGGRIVVRLSDHQAPNPASGDSGWLALSVADNGCGMDAETRSRMFEPFYSTKRFGHGLGLAMSNAIVLRSGGEIRVNTTPGEGSVFTVLLPRVDSPPDQLEVPTKAAAASEHRPLRILLVEEEEPVRTAIRALLERLGHQVMEAGDGAQALTLAADGNVPIDLLLSDYSLPELDGSAVARRLTAAQPEMRVLFIAGTADDVTGGLEDARFPYSFIDKPITTESLRRRLQEVIQLRSGSA